MALTADERTRSRYRYSISREITDISPDIGRSSVEGGPLDGIETNDVYLELPRGTVLRQGDCLGGDEHQQVLKIVAKSEPVLTVRAAIAPDSVLQLMRAAYHLGNRHVALEVGADYLRLAPDSVLETMLHQLGMAVTAETVPFQPETGAYGHHH
ncbi:MAG: urease accessory protein UreE [Cyanobacteria bacterium J06642_11]